MSAPVYHTTATCRGCGGLEIVRSDTRRCFRCEPTGVVTPAPTAAEPTVAPTTPTAATPTPAAPLSPRVVAALRDLGAPVTEGDLDPTLAGARLALVVAPRRRWECADEATFRASRALATALTAGDLPAAEQAALWIVEPARAMAEALRATVPTAVRAVA